VLDYLAGRLGQLLLVLFGVSVVVFIAMHLLPGDVATLLLGDRATVASLARLRHQLGLDQPVIVQYWRFITGALSGDFGTSLRDNRPAFAEVLAAFPVTLQLTLAALLLAVAIGVPLGVFAALNEGRWIDTAITTPTLFGVSMPVFWLGLMALLLFSEKLGWLPVGGVMPIGTTMARPTGLSVVDAILSGRFTLVVEALRHLLLPAATLATIPLALITRITRGEMLSSMHLDHVRTARAKGLPEARVIRAHILRNALIPIITVIGLQLGLLLSGAVLTETIFSLPGLGRLMVDGILARDYPLVQAGALFVAAVFVLVNFGVDLCYAALDPRIRRR
jgi:ABC-type dipeptide/oligopeptide/nickel transport system permease component